MVLDPLTFLSRLAAQVPPPRMHLLTYHGVLGPAAKDRARVVPDAATVAARVAQRVASGGGCAARLPDPREPRLRSFRQGTRRRRLPWAELMMRVFAIDVLQ